MAWFEHRIPPPVVGVLAAAAMWGIARLAPALEFAFPGHLVLAIAIAVGGLCIDVAGVLEFRRSRTTVNPLRPEKASVLVTSGIFRWTRNPMYLGMAVMLLAWAVYVANPLSLVLIPAFVAYLSRFQIAAEERALQERFGAGFLEYRKAVRRWL